MRTTALAAVIISTQTLCGIAVSRAADILWEVENPYRFFKRTSSFEMQERAFNAVRGAPGQPLPTNILWKVERRLNDPDCKDSSTPDNCLATARPGFERSRLGWASQTVDLNCYDRNARPRRYVVMCDRQYSWGTAREDYILPDAHTVVMQIAPERLATVGAGDCVWTWQPKRGGLPGETRKQACHLKLVIRRVPFSLDRSVSGVSVKVQLPDGTTLADPNVAVEDVFVVAMGDSFASGESNPDRPVTFSKSREMVYDPINANDQLAYRGIDARSRQYAVAGHDSSTNPKALPKRVMEDEEKGTVFKLSSREFQEGFDRSGAQWLSPDCHRSQYGYPFRVSIGLALENRHRAVTFVSLACSGADIVEGLFAELDAREQISGSDAQRKVAPQLDQLSDLICKAGAAGRTRTVSYRLPVYTSGSTAIGEQVFTKHWCPPESRKRPVDALLLSIGGNDVGFGPLVAYAMTESASDLAPIVGLVGHELRFAPSVSQAYLRVLDRRMRAVKEALNDAFGVDASRVLQNAYEPIQFDEAGNVCGGQATLGLDVHPKLRYSGERTQEVANFVRDLQVRLECITDGRKAAGCPAGLATSGGTGFHLITDHIAEFAKRGVCARDPQKLLVDQVNMNMPRLSHLTDQWVPYSPAAALPYAHHWRLARSPNDTFLAANTHREGISAFDDLQPAYAALYSGAFHPTAEGHVIVADHVLRHVNELLEKRSMAQN